MGRYICGVNHMTHTTSRKPIAPSPTARQRYHVPTKTTHCKALSLQAHLLCQRSVFCDQRSARALKSALYRAAKPPLLALRQLELPRRGRLHGGLLLPQRRQRGGKVGGGGVAAAAICCGLKLCWERQAAGRETETRSSGSIFSTARTSVGQAGSSSCVQAAGAQPIWHGTRIGAENWSNFRAARPSAVNIVTPWLPASQGSMPAGQKCVHAQGSQTKH